MLKMIMNWGIVLTAVALTSSPAGATPGTKGGVITAPPSPMGMCPMGMRC